MKIAKRRVHQKIFQVCHPSGEYNGNSPCPELWALGTKRSAWLSPSAKLQVWETCQTQSCAISFNRLLIQRRCGSICGAKVLAPFPEGQCPWIFNKAGNSPKWGGGEAEWNWVVWVSHYLDYKTEKRRWTIFIDLGPIFSYFICCFKSMCFAPSSFLSG